MTTVTNEKLYREILESEKRVIAAVERMTNPLARDIETLHETVYGNGGKGLSERVSSLETRTGWMAVGNTLLTLVASSVAAFLGSKS